MMRKLENGRSRRPERRLQRILAILSADGKRPALTRLQVKGVRSGHPIPWEPHPQAGAAPGGAAGKPTEPIFLDAGRRQALDVRLYLEKSYKTISGEDLRRGPQRPFRRFPRRPQNNRPNRQGPPFAGQLGNDSFSLRRKRRGRRPAAARPTTGLQPPPIRGFPPGR